MSLITKKEDEIVKILNNMAGKYPANKIFNDWITMYALAIANGCKVIHDEIWESREAEYKNIARKYKKEEWKNIETMCMLLNEALSIQEFDVLGDIYMREGYGERRTKQYYTPFEISELSARIITNQEYEKTMKVHEPTCGSGSMIIAIAKEMRRKGQNYQDKMQVFAQDLDWNNVYMTYIQLSLLNIKAVVIQGDTLEEPFNKLKTEITKIFETPAQRLFRNI